MKAIINPKVKKHLPYILIVCIAASFLVLFVDYRYAEKYSDFVNVDAVIADVTRETTCHGESQKTSYDILVKYKYSYDGKKDVYERNIFALITALLLLCDFFLWKGLHGVEKGN